MASKKNQEKSVVNTVSIIMIIVMVGKLTGLLRDALSLATYGDSMEFRAFSLASLIPRNFLDFAFASTISASFIPVFNHVLEKKGKKDAVALANQFITLILIISTISTVLLFIFADPFVAIIGQDHGLETQVLTVSLLRIMLPTIIISGVAFSLTGVLESFQVFNVPAFMSVLSNIIICGYLLFLNDRFSIKGLSVAFLIGWFSQLLILLPSLRKKEFTYGPNFSFRDAPMREIGKLALPALIGGWITPVNSLVNTMIIGEQITPLNTAYSLYSVISGVFVLSIANVIFPRLARMASRETGEIGESLESTLSGMLFLLIPLSVGVFLLGKPLIILAYEHGAFTRETTILTNEALKFYALGMAGFGIQTIVSRGFYAQKDGITPFITSVICIILNYILAKIFTPFMGVGGPPLASSISITVTAVIMLFIMSKKESLWTMKNSRNTAKVIFASLIMGFWVFWIAKLPIHFVLQLFLGAGAGVLVFFLVSFLCKTNETEMLQQAFLARKNR